MTPRSQDTIAARERRTQEARIAALFARPRTCYRAGQGILAAVASFFSSLLVRHLRSHGCELLREGGNHTVFVNRAAGKAAVIPRHREINDFLARKICRDLETPEP